MIMSFIIYSGTCLIRHTKGPGKCVGLYRMLEYSGFFWVNWNTLGSYIFVGCHRMSENSGVRLHRFHCICLHVAGLLVSWLSDFLDCISGIISLSVVDHGLLPRWSQTKDYKFEFDDFHDNVFKMDGHIMYTHTIVSVS